MSGIVYVALKNRTFLQRCAPFTTRSLNFYLAFALVLSSSAVFTSSNQNEELCARPDLQNMSSASPPKTEKTTTSSPTTVLKAVAVLRQDAPQSEHEDGKKVGEVVLTQADANVEVIFVLIYL